MVKLTNSGIYLTATNDSWSTSCYVNKVIDVTNLASIIFYVSGNHNTSASGAILLNSNKSIVRTIFEFGNRSINVYDLTGNYYIGFFTRGYNGANFYVTKIIAK